MIVICSAIAHWTDCCSDLLVTLYETTDSVKLL